MLAAPTEHNLKNIDVRIPLERLVCVTGVSGSGKSTLVQDVLYAGAAQGQGQADRDAGRVPRAAAAPSTVDDVVMVDQSPIGRTTRSNPASYVGAFDAIRKLFAQDAAVEGARLHPGTFSFNSGNGRCPTCRGNGFEHVEMQFLSDVYLRCPDCDGRRYRDEILEVKIDGTVDRRRARADGRARRRASSASTTRCSDRLQPLVDVGLEYLRLGQPVPTLSGGEAQRLKLAGHLADARRRAANKLFLFDEPTTGLHFDDVAKLLRAFRQLLAAGPFAGRDRAQPRRDPRRRTGSSTSAPKAATPAARWSAKARPTR